MNSTICMIFAILGMLAPLAAQQHPKSASTNDTEQILAAEQAWGPTHLRGLVRRRCRLQRTAIDGRVVAGRHQTL